MKKYILVLALLSLAGGKAFAREVTTCTDTTYTENQCHIETDKVCHTDWVKEYYQETSCFHKEHNNWHEINCNAYRPGNDYKKVTENKFKWVKKETCEDVDKEVCEDVTIPSQSCRTDQTFDKDTRCHATKPSLVTWAAYDPQNSTLNWSAEGGSKVELKFGWMEGFYPFRVMLTNDGHEKVGLGTEIGYWFNWFKMRTINDCRTGDWTYFN